MSNTDAACLIAVIEEIRGKTKLSPGVAAEWKSFIEKYRAGVLALSKGGSDDADD